LRDFAPYYTDKYKTPWGEALNYDGPYSDGVRNFFIENARHWFLNYHVDGLRLDAVHAILDTSARPFLRELALDIAQMSANLGRKYYLIAESDLNDPRLIQPFEKGGYGLDAQWTDDFHHALHVLLTGEKDGYYEDFGGTAALAKSLRDAYVYTGQYSVHRKRQFGDSTEGLASHQFIICTQNHDQVGNRMLGERLSTLVSFEAQKLAAGALLLSPFVPMLFMGEEYGEENPFLYFVSHSDTDLVAAVREGRKAEFAAFTWLQEPPDPQSEETFLRSRLDWQKRTQAHHATLLKFYSQLIELRRKYEFSRDGDQSQNEVHSPVPGLVYVHRSSDVGEVVLLMNFKSEAMNWETQLPGSSWRKIIDSAETVWNGPGSDLPERLSLSHQLNLAPQSFVMYEKSRLQNSL
ncbi:MAG TPA: malto-oligosyltrehalose trehalohydrolase, partial [Blastocatellia bacterium]|nr:malto-oligosyltrehalose trehalohydrolase [Blastocatellia bacterium]